MSKESPFKNAVVAPAAASAALPAIASIAGSVFSFIGANKARRQQARLQREAMAIEKEKLDLAKEEMARLEAQREEYKNFEFRNPFAGFGELFTQQENVFEDLTVDQRAAEFQKRTLNQQSANILDQLQTSAGASGIGALAQRLANQQAITASRISADIAKQERQNKLLAAEGEQSLQQQRLKGLMLEAQGDAMLQQAESGRQATLLGVSQASAAGANLAAEQTKLNSLEAQNVGTQMDLSRTQALSSLVSNLGNIDFNAFNFGNNTSSSQLTSPTLQQGSIVGLNYVPPTTSDPFSGNFNFSQQTGQFNPNRFDNLTIQ